MGLRRHPGESTCVAASLTADAQRFSCQALGLPGIVCGRQGNVESTLGAKAKLNTFEWGSVAGVCPRQRLLCSLAPLPRRSRLT